VNSNWDPIDEIDKDFDALPPWAFVLFVVIVGICSIAMFA